MKQVGEESDPGSWVTAAKRLSLEVTEGIRAAGQAAIEQGASLEEAVDSAIQGGKDALTDLAMETEINFETGFSEVMKGGCDPMDAIALGLESTELLGKPNINYVPGFKNDLQHHDKSILVEGGHDTITDALDIIKEESKPASEFDQSATSSKRNKISPFLEKYEKLPQDTRYLPPRAQKEKLHTIDRQGRIPEHVRHELDIMKHGGTSQAYEDIVDVEVPDEGPSIGANDLDITRSASSQPLDSGDNNLQDHFFEYSRNFDYDAAIKHWQKQNRYASSAPERFHAARVSTKLLQQREQLNRCKGWCNDVQRTHPELSWPQNRRISRL